jgi:hypothetical protein
LGGKAFTAEGAESAEKIKKKEPFLLPCFSLCGLRVLCGEMVFFSPKNLKYTPSDSGHASAGRSVLILAERARIR